MTKVEIIKEAVSYYSKDTERRGLSAEGDCCYLTKEGKMCAVGRCLLPSIRGKVESYWSVADIAKKLKKGVVDNIFRKKYKGHSTLFWQDLQCLHDVSLNWGDKGTTEEGKREVERLIKVWENK